MKKRKLRWKNIISFLIIIIFLILFIYSIINIIKWLIDSNSTSKEINQIESIAQIEESPEGDNFNEPEDKTGLYWDYIKMNLIDVDFNELIKKNSDTVGWIQVNGTNINYPIVQADNNEYYLTHSFEKKNNNAGWVFMDYRNNNMELDQNTIIYAHGRNDKTMFGTLKNLTKSNWYKDKNNHVIKLSTKSANTLWQVFSVYHIPTTSDYLTTSFHNETSYQAFLDMLKNRSIYNFETNLNCDDKIVTLSTCYNETEKVVMHAKLIKIQIKE